MSFKHQDDIVFGIAEELVSRSDFFAADERIATVYFGGGTPSVLNKEQISTLLSIIKQHYNLVENPEITFECNPDDLSLDYLQMLKSVGVNRLSIGIQSFDESHLKWMNRSHTAAQSLKCVTYAAQVGFEDITIDLIYGIPALSAAQWRDTVQQALQLPINHLSAYSLTLEENTPYKKLVQQKKYVKPNEDQSSEHYDILIQEINAANWEHYEVSNFCKKGNYSKHNTAYWQHKKYLGVGPSAHSFDQKSRMWNVSSNKIYLELLAADKNTYEIEILSATDKLNEQMLTGLRATWGVNLAEIHSGYGYDIRHLYNAELNAWMANGWAKLDGDQFSLTDSGFLFADYIASELFASEE